MRLTLHYKLAAPALPVGEIRELVQRLRKYALELPFEKVLEVVEFKEDGCRPDCGERMGEYAWLKTQTMRFRMLLLQNVGSSTAADECQHIDFSGFHERANDLRPLSVDCADHAPWEGIPECLQQWLVKQNTQFRWLEYHRIAHDECGDQGRKGFIERVVEGAHA